MNFQPGFRIAEVQLYELFSPPGTLPGNTATMAIQSDLHCSGSAPSASVSVSGNSVQGLQNKCTEKCHLMLYSFCLIARSLAQGRVFPLLFMKLLREVEGGNLSLNSPIQCNTLNCAARNAALAKHLSLSSYLCPCLVWDG